MNKKIFKKIKKPTTMFRDATSTTSRFFEYVAVLVPLVGIYISLYIYNSWFFFVLLEAACERNSKKNSAPLFFTIIFDILITLIARARYVRDAYSVAWIVVSCWLYFSFNSLLIVSVSSMCGYNVTFSEFGKNIFISVPEWKVENTEVSNKGLRKFLVQVGASILCYFYVVWVGII